MRLEEIFPMDKFPLVAETIADIPETDLKLKVKIFYQTPLGLGLENEQNAQLSQVINADGSCLFSVVNLTLEDGGERTYLGSGAGDYEVVDDELSLGMGTESEKVINEELVSKGLDLEKLTDLLNNLCGDGALFVPGCWKMSQS